MLHQLRVALLFGPGVCGRRICTAADVQPVAWRLHGTS